MPASSARPVVLPRHHGRGFSLIEVAAVLGLGTLIFFLAITFSGYHYPAAFYLENDLRAVANEALALGKQGDVTADLRSAGEGWRPAPGQRDGREIRGIERVVVDGPLVTVATMGSRSGSCVDFVSQVVDRQDGDLGGLVGDLRVDGEPVLGPGRTVASAREFYSPFAESPGGRRPCKIEITFIAPIPPLDRR